MTPVDDSAAQVPAVQPPAWPRLFLAARGGRLWSCGNRWPGPCLLGAEGPLPKIRVHTSEPAFSASPTGHPHAPVRVVLPSATQMHVSVEMK